MEQTRLPKALLLFFAGYLLGTLFVSYPAAANILTSPKYHDLTAHQYGSLFIPSIIGSLLISFCVGIFERKKGHRAVFITALISNAIAAFTFSSTELFLEDKMTDFGILLISLFFSGLGFGSMVSILTPYMVALFPKHAHAATVGIFGVVCLGASFSPLLFHLFTEVGLWWLDPLIIGVLFLLLACLTIFILPGKEEESALFPKKPEQVEQKGSLPLLFWGFFTLMLTYGILMTIFANWTTIYLHQEKHFPTAVSSLALSLYWGMMMVGRAVIVGGDRWISQRIAYAVMPALMLISFLVVPFTSGATANLLVFAFAGIAFSATFPLNFSFSVQTFPEKASFVSGMISAAYMIGFGISAYGVGFLYEILGIPLKDVFLYASILALLMLLLAIAVMRNKRIRD